METENKSINPGARATENHPRNSGRIWGGLIIVIVGAVLLARQAGVELPWWLFRWEMFMIVIGLYIGIRNSFRDYAWLIVMSIGIVFLVDDFVDDFSIKRYFWPVLIIVVGLLMIFRPRNRNRNYGWSSWDRDKNYSTASAQTGSDELLDCVTIFGGIKKNIITKNFRGGEAFTLFGGTELNLIQADINERAALELTQIFGGTKLIVPPHWKIHSDELVSILGGVNDKRPLPATGSAEPTKLLVLKGTCIFGGIDIVSY